MFSNLCQQARRFLVGEEGATAVEHAVIIMLIFLAVLTAIQLVGSMTADSYQDTSQKLDAAMNGS